MLRKYYKASVLLGKVMCLKSSSIVEMEEISFPTSIQQNRSRQLVINRLLRMKILIIFYIPDFEGHICLISLKLTEINFAFVQPACIIQLGGKPLNPWPS